MTYLCSSCLSTQRENVAKGTLHGVREPEALFANITKAAFVVFRERDLLATLEAAFRTAASPRQGPVLVSIPYRLLDREVTVPEGEGGSEDEAGFDPAPLERALKDSKRPVIIGGSGLKGYPVGDLLDTLCRESDIPFLTSTGGKGTVREDKGYALGNVMAKGVAREVLGAADLTIAIGTRLRDVDTKRRGVKLGRLVHIEIGRPMDRAELPYRPRHDGTHRKGRRIPPSYHERQEHVVGYGGAEEDKRAGRGPP